MRKLIVGLLVVLALMMVATVAAYNTWGVWGLVGLFAVCIVGLFALKALARRIITSLFLAPFKMKGKVLRGATIDVHDVKVAEPPEVQSDEEELLDDEDFDTPEEAEEYRKELEEEFQEAATSRARRQWFFVDMTITPQEQPENGFQHWEPEELTLVDPSSEPLESFNDGGEDDEVGEIAEVMIWDSEQETFNADEQCKYAGPQRLRFRLGVDPGNSQIALRYYFEQFGDLQLPVT